MGAMHVRVCARLCLSVRLCMLCAFVLVMCVCVRMYVCGVIPAGTMISVTNSEKLTSF